MKKPSDFNKFQVSFFVRSPGRDMPIFLTLYYDLVCRVNELLLSIGTSFM